MLERGQERKILSRVLKTVIEVEKENGRDKIKGEKY